MKKLDLVKSIKTKMKGIIFQIDRIGEKRVSLNIIKPLPDKDGFITKFYKTGKIESISFYKRRTMTRDYFNK